MQFNDEQIVFEIPELSDDWVFLGTIFHDEEKQLFYLSKKGNQGGFSIGNVAILHTIIGDINKFNITCRDFNTSSPIFSSLIEPIFKKYCQENNIDLYFDYLYDD
jgi:hypothetical protein